MLRRVGCRHRVRAHHDVNVRKVNIRKTCLRIKLVPQPFKPHLSKVSCELLVRLSQRAQAALNMFCTPGQLLRPMKQIRLTPKAYQISYPMMNPERCLPDECLFQKSKLHFSVCVLNCVGVKKKKKNGVSPLEFAMAPKAMFGLFHSMRN